MAVLIGADPELFALRGNQLAPAPGMIRGNKRKPLKVRNGAVQVDGLALEFNINPVEKEDDFFTSITDVMATLRDMLPEGASLARCVEGVFDNDTIDALNPEALEIGCDPDFNAYLDGAPNSERVVLNNIRHAGGHIHVGWTEGQDIYDSAHLGSCMTLVRLMDQYLGVPSVLMDGNERRREGYGIAGCFRPKPYGVEYRTLSNFWIHEEKLIRWVYRTVQAIVDGSLVDVDPLQEVPEIIADSNYPAAAVFIEDHGIYMP